MNFNMKIIVAGFALMLFAVVAALNAAVYDRLAGASLIVGGLGLFLALAGCIGRQEPVRNADKDKDGGDPDARGHGDR
jgi:hypothetical protein